MADVDVTRDFLAFFQTRFEVAGDYGPYPIVDPAIKAFLRKAFTETGEPRYSTVMDARPKKSGKSALAGGVGLYMAARKADSEVYIASSSREQSRDRILRIVKYAVRKLKASGRSFWKDVVIGQEFIRLPNHSSIQVVGMNWKAAAGANAACIIHDELHTATLEAERRRFDELLIPPQIRGIRWMASYAGYDDESDLLREWWDLALEGERVTKRYPIYANDDFLALIDTGKESWRYPWMHEAEMAKIERQERPKSFTRLWLNEWVSSEGQFIEDALWNACFNLEGPLEPNKKIPIFLGLDLGTAKSGDDAAAIGVYPGEDGRVHVSFYKVWEGKKRTSQLQLSESVEPWLIKKSQDFYISGLWFDAYQSQRMIENLRHYMSCFPVPQSLPVLGPLGATLYKMIEQQALRMYVADDDTHLLHATKHAIGREIPAGIHIKKASRTHKVDLLVALSFVASRAWDKRLTGPRLAWRMPKKSRWKQQSWNLPAHGQRPSRFANIGTNQKTGSRWRRF